MDFGEALKGIMAGEIWSCYGTKYWYSNGAIHHTACDDDEDITLIKSEDIVSEDWMKADGIFTLTFFEAMAKAKEGKKVTNRYLCRGCIAPEEKKPYYKRTDGFLRYYNCNGIICSSTTIDNDEICSKWGVLE